jgi:Putative beta-barrel porin-2, OmpL-like. bbp2
MTPGNYLYTHSLLHIFDPFTQMGVVNTVKLNDQWLIQFGAHAGNDVAFWEKADAKFTPMACIRWTSKDNNDSIYPCVNSINNGKYVYDNIQMFVNTWSHKFSDSWNMEIEFYYTYQRDVPSVSSARFRSSRIRAARCVWPSRSPTSRRHGRSSIIKTSKSQSPTILYSAVRGQRTGTQTRYSTHSVGWGIGLTCGAKTPGCSGPSSDTSIPTMRRLITSAPGRIN